MSAPQDQARVSVRILEKEYFIACPYEERSALLDSAEFLNSRMREVRDSGDKGYGNVLLSRFPVASSSTKLLSYDRGVAHMGIYINGRLLSGAHPYETFAGIIDEELSRK